MSIYSPPDDYLKSMQPLLGDDYPAFAAIYAHSPGSGLRLNTLKIGGLEQITKGLDPVPWCPAGFVIYPPYIPPATAGGNEGGEPTPRPLKGEGWGGGRGKHPYHAAGLYYLQDPSAMAVAEILNPQPGERVLDLSAAPGGKSTHLSALMGDWGLLIANEIHPQRAWELAENLERWGVRNAAITNETPERLAAHFGAAFERVLVDAPCSGEGMFRKSAAAQRDWSPGLVQSCALRQSSILEQAARLVRPGGRLVYATCTFNPVENEAVVADFLSRHAEFELLEIPAQPGFDPGRPDWLPAGAAALHVDLSRAVRLWPHRSPGDGHFIALLQKAAGVDFVADVVRHKVNKIDSGAHRIFEEFCQASLDVEFDPQHLLQAGSYLYQLPEHRFTLGGLKVIHPGWWLGTFKKGRSVTRFVPSHALALGLQAGEVCRTLDLPAEGGEVQAYLRGETLAFTSQDGWLLVTVDGYPLGWGRRAGGVIKNYYPRGLREYYQ